MGALTDRYKAILKKQAWHKRLMEWHKDSHPLTKNTDGTPKVFYHGTVADFDEFDASKAKRALWGEGFYFAEDVSTANKYANNGSVMPVFLNIKNPLDLTKGIPIYTARKIIPNIDTLDIAHKNGVIEANDFKYFLGKQKNSLEVIKNAGYDGIKYFEDRGVKNSTEDYIGYVVFSPSQIKSIHNKGTFDENSAVITDSVTFDMSFDAESRYIDKSRDMIKINKLIKDAEETLPQPIRSFEDFKKQFQEADTDNNVKLNIHGVSIEFNLYGVWKHLVPQNNTHYDDRNTISGAFVKTIRDPLLIVRQPHKGREIVFYKAFRGSPLYNLAAFKFTNGKFTYYDLKNNMNKVKEIIKTPDQNTLYFKYSRQEKILRTKEWQSEPAINQIIPKNTNKINMDGAETMNVLKQIKIETSVLAKTKLVKEWRSLGVADKAKIIKEYRNEIKEDYIEIKNIRAEYIKHISIDQFKKEYLIIRKPPKKFFTKTNHDIFVSPKNKEIFNFKKMVFSPRHVSTGLYKRGLMNLLSYFNLTKFGATIKGNIDGVDVVLGTVIEGKISIEDAYRNHGELIDFANSLKIRQLRIEGESSAVITDSIASFGLNNPKYKGKPKEAIAYLMESKKGQVVGAMNHPEIGEIDFVYGNNKRGLKHIFERRLEQWKDEAKVLRFMSHIPEIILSAKSFGKNNKGNIELKSNRYTISLATHNYGKEKIWLLSSLIDRRNKSLGIETVHGDAIQSEPSHTSYQHDNGHILSNSQIIPKNQNKINMDGAETMNILQQIKTETGLLAKTKLLKQWGSLGLLQRKKALQEYGGIRKSCE